MKLFGIVRNSLKLSTTVLYWYSVTCQVPGQVPRGSKQSFGADAETMTLQTHAKVADAETFMPNAETSPMTDADAELRTMTPRKKKKMFFF